MATSTIKMRTFNGVIAVASLTHRADESNKWEVVGSFTINKPALIFAASSYNNRTTGLGFDTSNNASAPSLGAIENDNHIYKTPVFYISPGTIYLYAKTSATTATNTYTVYATQ